jgi:pyruvate dehydrogenase E2 component (dihydrolipoamide acetyltransferase)
LPDLGEGLTESEIVSWKVGVGDTVSLNQVIAEVETAKAVVELPSPYAGVVTALLEQPGTVVEVGKPIVSFEIEDDGAPAGAGAPASGGGQAAAAKREPNLVGYGAVLESSGRPARRFRPRRFGPRRWPSRFRLRRPSPNPAQHPILRSAHGPHRRCANWPRTSGRTSKP